MPGLGLRTASPEGVDRGPRQKARRLIADSVGWSQAPAVDAGQGGSHKTAMETDRAVILAQPYAGLQAQAVGLAERSGLAHSVHALMPLRPWRWMPAARWPMPMAAIEPLGILPDGLVMSVGGVGGALGAALRRRGRQVVQIQNPRMRLDRFDLVVANTHDELDGPNVLVSRNALHQVGALQLREARGRWLPRFAHLPRPLVAVLVGGSNGRYRLDGPVGTVLAGQLGSMMRADRVGLMVTPSRRTGTEVRAALETALSPLGAWIWTMQGENPYLGMLACADAIIVTNDSVSMISEAVATSVPVMVAALPGRSRRIGLFVHTMRQAGRVRWFGGRLEEWRTQALDDTPAVADAMRRRLGLRGHTDADTSIRAATE